MWAIIGVLTGIYRLPGLWGILAALALSLVIGSLGGLVLQAWLVSIMKADLVPSPQSKQSQYLYENQFGPEAKKAQHKRLSTALEEVDREQVSKSLSYPTLPQPAFAVMSQSSCNKKGDQQVDDDDNSWAESLGEELSDEGIPDLPPLEVYNDVRIQELREIVVEQLAEYRDFFRYGDERTGVTREQWLMKHPELNEFLRWYRSDHGEKVRRKTNETIDIILEYYLVWQWV